MLSDRQSLGSGCRPGRRRSRESRISADVRTGESGDRSTPSAPAQSSTPSLSGTATVPPGSSSPTMDSASRLAWSVTDSTASRSDRSSISDIGSAMIDNPPLPRGLFDTARRPLDVLPVGRWRLDRPLFAFPRVVRLAAALVPRFVRVLRFPLIFFLPELRFVCRAISSSPRIRAPDGCSLLHRRTCKERTPLEINNEAFRCAGHRNVLTVRDDRHRNGFDFMAGSTGLEPATSGLTVLVVGCLHRPHFRRLAFSDGTRWTGHLWHHLGTRSVRLHELTRRARRGDRRQHARPPAAAQSVDSHPMT